MTTIPAKQLLRSGTYASLQAALSDRELGWCTDSTQSGLYIKIAGVLIKLNTSYTAGVGITITDGAISTALTTLNFIAPDDGEVLKTYQGTSSVSVPINRYTLDEVNTDGALAATQDSQDGTTTCRLFIYDSAQKGTVIGYMPASIGNQSTVLTSDGVGLVWQTADWLAQQATHYALTLKQNGISADSTYDGSAITTINLPSITSSDGTVGVDTSNDTIDLSAKGVTITSQDGSVEVNNSSSESSLWDLSVERNHLDDDSVSAPIVGQFYADKSATDQAAALYAHDGTLIGYMPITTGSAGYMLGASATGKGFAWLAPYVGSGAISVSSNVISVQTDGKTILVDSGSDQLKTGLSLGYDASTATIQLKDSSGNVVSSIDGSAFVKDGFLESVTYDSTTHILTFVWNTDVGSGSGTAGTVTEVDLASMIVTYKAGDYIDITGSTISHKASGVAAGSYGDGGSARVLSWGDTFRTVQVTLDAWGHVTGATTVALALPGLSAYDFRGTLASSAVPNDSYQQASLTKTSGVLSTSSNGVVLPAGLYHISAYINASAAAPETGSVYTDDTTIVSAVYLDGSLYDQFSFHPDVTSTLSQGYGFALDINIASSSTVTIYNKYVSTGTQTWNCSGELWVHSVVNAGAGGSSGGLSAVIHDDTLSGNGTIASPLSVVATGSDTYEVKVNSAGTAGYLYDKVNTEVPIQKKVENDQLVIYQDPVQASPLSMLSTPSVDNVLSTLAAVTNGTQQLSWIAIQAHAFAVPNYYTPDLTDIWNYININTQGASAEGVHFVGIYAYDLTTNTMNLVCMSENGASHDNTATGIASLATGYVNTATGYNIIKPGLIYYAFHACDQTALTVAGNSSSTFNLSQPYPSLILYNLRNGLTVTDFVTNYGTIDLSTSTLSHQESTGKRFLAVRHAS